MTESGNEDFLTILKSKWDEIHDKHDIFRYKIDNLQEKILDGYLLQLNPNRSSQRRTPERIDHIRQPFDKDKFNFTKVSPKEILFSIEMGVQEKQIQSSILVNVSPISQYHSLLCPSVNECLPQVVTEDSLEVTIKLMFQVGFRSFRIGFNSLCAFASVNHLHYHLFIVENVLPVETAKCDHLHGPVHCLSKGYPIPAFCFEVSSLASSSKASKEVYKLLAYFLSHSIAHNIFLTKGNAVTGQGEDVLRVLVWPRRSSVGVKQLAAFNVAVCELSGWFPIYNAESYANLQCADLENELKKWQIEDFEHLCEEIKKLY